MRSVSGLARVGLWSSVLVVVFSLGFSVPGLFAAAGVIGFPWDPVLPDGSSLLLAWAFVVMMSALHSSVAPPSQPWMTLGLVFAAMYSVLVSMVYFVILTVVVPLTQRGRGEEVVLLQFDDQGSFLQAVDGLGYFLMCVSTFVAAFAFARTGPERWVRWVFLANGVLGIPILIAYMPLVVSWSAVLLPINALWILSVPSCGVVAARYFRRIAAAPVE